MSSMAKVYLLAKWGGDPLGGPTGLGFELAVKGEGEAHLYFNSHIRMRLDRERQYQGRLAEIWGKHQQVEYTWLYIFWYLVRLLMGGGISYFTPLLLWNNLHAYAIWRLMPFQPHTTTGWDYHCFTDKGAEDQRGVGWVVRGAGKGHGSFL